MHGKVVGLSVTGANYHNALRIAQEAKERGAKVILGGPHATVKHEQILQRRKYIDAVVRGEGEIPFSGFLEAIKAGSELSKIKSLSYRDTDGAIIVNPSLRKSEEIDLNEVPPPDYALLGELVEVYAKNFQQHHYRKEGFTRFVGLESQKGCAKVERPNRGKMLFLYKNRERIEKTPSSRILETSATTSRP